MWMSMISDGHDMCCGCTRPFAHLLDSIFPEGHKDRNKTVQQIIQRDLTCLSGGQEEENDGMAAGTSAATLQLVKEEEEDPGTEGDIEDLIAAVEDAEKR